MNEIMNSFTMIAHLKCSKCKRKGLEKVQAVHEGNPTIHYFVCPNCGIKYELYIGLKGEHEK